MKFFSKKETRAVLTILLVIALISLPNFLVSLRRARDAQRKADLGSIHDGLIRYHDDFGVFPSSIDGKIAACAPYEIKKENDRITVIFSPCQWGESSLTDLSDPSFPPYLKVLPKDPQAAKGFDYLYFSNGNRFQLYATLEGKGEDEYDPKIIARDLKCGKNICNSGRAYSKTPLDKSIEEYENELRPK